MKLSICIPTLNRAPFIGATLESIISQATDETEIVIVDGGSRDNTDAVLESYSRKFSRLRYVRSPTSETQQGKPSNSGFDLDCNHAVEIARGEYCWLMTDDDLLLPGAVAAVLDKIATGADLVIVDAEVRNADFSRLWHERRLPLRADRVYETGDFEDFFVDTCDHLSFVGAIIIKRSEWLERAKQPYVGSGFIHVGVLFQRPFERQIIVVAKPLVRIRFGNALWSSRSFVIWNVNWPELVWSFMFSEEAKRKVVSREPWRDIRKLVAFRFLGGYSMAQYQAIIAPTLKSRWSFLPGIWIARIPVAPLRVLVGLKRLLLTGSWN